MRKRILSLILILTLVAALLGGCQTAPPAETQEPLTDPEVDPMAQTKVDKLFENLKEDDPQYFRKLAEFAVADVLDHFWDFENNHVLPTWNGLPAKDTDYDWRGSFWETGQCVYGIYDMWLVTGNSYYENLLQGEAAFIKKYFTVEELTTAGGNENWATDDCFWNCMLYLIMYDVTGDNWFINVTSGLLDSAMERWYDDVTGGGMYYKDNVDRKSMYEMGAAISWMRLWQITGEQRYYDLATASYEWMYNSCGAGRDDGLYFCEINAYGGIGGTTDIHEAGSSSFLTANMGMAAMSVMMYNLTNDQKYLDRAYKTCEGLLKYYNDGGVLLDDRDGWTNGAYASYFASYVLSLDGTDEIRALCQATAKSVILNDRTPDGYYGATWKGPAEGSMSLWWCGGTIPQQSATTGTAVSMVTSQAIWEAGIKDYVR